jgi:nucleotide-binding universal stress UspA family protein
MKRHSYKNRNHFLNFSGGILDFDEENNFDLIVIGTRARSRFKRSSRVSVVPHVVAYATCLIARI